MRPINEIIVHCSATQPNWMADKPTIAKVREIDRWHRARGWRGIGYHFVIDRDGETLTGRPLEQIGAHVKGHNTGTVGICLLGGHGSAETDAFSDNFTMAQDKALREQIGALRARFPSISTVSGHNDYTRAKACPGFKVPDWLESSDERTDQSTQQQQHHMPSPLQSLIQKILEIFAFLQRK